MVRNIDWGSQIGHRVKLRALHVFCTVAQRGSMAQAAERIGISQPAISEMIADLEHTLGVRLFDRSRHGVELTIYGRSLFERSKAVFDELTQGIRDLEFLADPSVGEVRIGCPETLVAAIMPPIVQAFCKDYPRVVLHVVDVVATTLDLPELRNRTLDMVLARSPQPLPPEADGLNIEHLFNDELVLVAGAGSQWARRDKVELAELVNVPWIMTPAGYGTGLLADSFAAQGLDMPKISVVTFSVHLRAHLLATGDFVTVLPRSVLRLNGDLFSLKVLPIALPVRPWPLGIITVKDRTLPAVAQLFIDHLRKFGKTMAQVEKAA